jgi:peptidoglycan hydrolase-like protein with peptidoglycan-binding domain
MFYSYLLSAFALAAVSVTALLYTVAGEGERPAPARVSVDRRAEEFSARYREQLTLTQEALRDFGYTLGPSDGIMGSSTASALRAFQRRAGLRVTGRANPETLAALGIEDRLSRRPP